MRRAGTRRSFISAWNSTSVAEAVVVAEYCGYIGSTISRSTPCPIISCSNVGHRRIADLHAEAHRHLGQELLQGRRSASRVMCSSGEPVCRVPDAAILGGRLLPADAAG